ncbi:hypothetical protein EV183_003156 [Coemansia sp. RSA 2336]|nr:hypothetical protein EV183_003156 [Coemansia sp. RSA 2336]
MLAKSSLTRPLEEEEPDIVPLKRAKTCSVPASMQRHLQLGLPIDKALVQSYTFFAPLPLSSETAGSADGFVLGVDEAGRGPVLGPMVYATCFCRESYYSSLTQMGFADSKQLNETQREDLFDRLQTERTHVGWSIRCISPQDISHCMLRRAKYSLNALAHDATIQLIRDVLEKGIRVTKVFVDTVGPPLSYQKKLQELFPGIDIVVAKKADSLYPIVSAASICAKVTRDAHLSHWIFAEPGVQKMLSNEYGSGYPSDPNTTKWLRDSVDRVFGYPGLIRFSWSTCTKLLEDRAAKVVWPDDEDKPKAKSKYFTQAADSQRSKFLSRNKSLLLASSL